MRLSACPNAFGLERRLGVDVVKWYAVLLSFCPVVEVTPANALSPRPTSLKILISLARSVKKITCLKCLNTQTGKQQSNLESINVVVPLKSVDETLVCDHSYESYRAVLSLMWYCLLLTKNDSRISRRFELRTLGSERVLACETRETCGVSVLQAVSANK